MAVLLRTRIKKGWKNTENNRIGNVFVVEFVRDYDEEVLFSYAPKLNEAPFWLGLFDDVQEYDKTHKEIKDFEDAINSQGFFNVEAGLTESNSVTAKRDKPNLLELL